MKGEFNNQVLSSDQLKLGDFLQIDMLPRQPKIMGVLHG
jgi:hypothetical protein